MRLHLQHAGNLLHAITRNVYTYASQKYNHEKRFLKSVEKEAQPEILSTFRVAEVYLCRKPCHSATIFPPSIYNGPSGFSC